MIKPSFICVYAKQANFDVKGRHLCAKAKRHLNLDLKTLHTAKIYVFSGQPDQERLEAFAKACLSDPVTEAIVLNDLPPNWPVKGAIVVAKLAGVTDDEGHSAQTAWADFNGLAYSKTQIIFSQDVFAYEEDLPSNLLKPLAENLLANTLINKISYTIKNQDGSWHYQPFLPEVSLKTEAKAALIDLEGLDDAALMALSKQGLWALNLAEMQAIQAYFLDSQTKLLRQSKGLTEAATDCELEILAQTWSEHCKHKEFNADIHYKDLDTGEITKVSSLFKTFIKGATDRVQEALLAKGNDWLVKVFSDNAGVVRASKDWLFVWKVETHNSPSALDPYGGAITGILGNNRDPLGTGIGGAKLLFNTNVLCFGPPNYARPLLAGQLHPRRVMEGVVAGIEDGGNKSGIPTVNGSMVFDERFAGKPLVYCGTGGLLPHDWQGRPSWEKRIDVGDLIYMAGGRVGKDGIHGATFSSLEIDEKAPASAVQIGSPLTQKKLYDFMLEACALGLIKCSTDNGAGGLSSSVGELAQLSGGAVVQLEKVPLKYSGLKPWEIFVSESQERMTLVIEPSLASALEDLAQAFEVEVSAIGHFDDSGFLEVRYEAETLAYLSLEFLHEGTPKKVLQAEWRKPQGQLPPPRPQDLNQTLLELLSAWNICSKAAIIRRYDHEVKGRTLIKPLMGRSGQAPQDAALIRLDWQTSEAIAVSNGILPRYGDLDPYQMSCGAFDEAVRQIIAIGGSLPNQNQNDEVFWSVNDNFCVPDSVYDPQTNPDGKEKLAKLVQMCQGLYDMATAWDIPLTSGKDSMKNDFRVQDQKISVPPTVLYSMTAKIPDLHKTQTAEFKQAGHLIYQINHSYEELGASEYYHLLGSLGQNPPIVRPEQAKTCYQKVFQAHQQGWLASCHDLSDGGLAIALAEACFGGYELGAEIQLDQLDQNLSLEALLFGESHSRFLVSIPAKHQAAFEQHFGPLAYLLGQVSPKTELKISLQNQTLIQLPIDQLLQAWTQSLVC